MKKLFIISLSFISISFNALGFKDEVRNVYSKSMNKEVPTTVVTPDTYNSDCVFPVVYLLHGYSDNHRTWVDRTDIEALADEYGLIIVLPDGGFDSWYFDSEIASDYQYETFVTYELVDYIDKNFHTIKDRSGRAITGQSMGGHGAMHSAIKHSDVYGAVGSMSGGVDIRPFPHSWNIDKRLGAYTDNAKVWEKSTIINMTHLIQPSDLNIIIDCGTDDFFYEVNCNLHQKLMDDGIPHDFYVRPGGHNWVYWRNAIKYQMLFFNECFSRINSCANIH